MFLQPGRDWVLLRAVPPAWTAWRCSVIMSARRVAPCVRGVRSGLSDGPAGEEARVASDDRERDEKHQRIRTAMAAARLVLWAIWTALDPRHPG
jgi:hypothetical protein